MGKVYTNTTALCPSCKKKVDAKIVEKDDMIFLEKSCAEHGLTYALVSSDVKWYEESRSYVKPKQKPLDYSVKEYSGCPDSCGLCSEHQQHTCLPIIEVNSDCDMNCPICLKEFKEPFTMTVDEFGFVIDRLFECEGAVNVINLSGGEPTIHPDFDKLLHISKGNGVMQTTVSTNGNVFLSDRERMVKLFKETDTMVALQFDGFLPETYRFLRGEDLSQKKLEIIKVLEDEGIEYTLTPTIVKGVNDKEVTSIVDFMFESKALSISFQPATFTGAASKLDESTLRATIPDVVREIEKSKYVNKGDLNPLPCAHYTCFALAYYFALGDGSFYTLKNFLEKENYLNVISNRTLPGLDCCGYDMITDRLYDFWSAADASTTSEHIMKKIRKVIKELGKEKYTPKRAFKMGNDSMKAIFIHQFMDVHTLDFDRLRQCCNHYPRADGRIVPMCSYNVFNQ